MAKILPRKSVTPRLLQELLIYDPEAGKLVWVARLERHYEHLEGSQKRGVWRLWNTRNAGKPAFTAIGRDGHHFGTVFGHTFFAHRVAWAIYYGVWPTHSIDHINGDPGDNRIENLRDVPHILNMHNKHVSKANKSGVTGVVNRSGSWLARICVDRKEIHLGSFRTKEEAVHARKAAETRFGVRVHAKPTLTKGDRDAG